MLESPSSRQSTGDNEIAGLSVAALSAIIVTLTIVPLVHPLVLGALVEAGNLSLDQMGFVAMSEYLATAATTAIAAVKLKPVHLRAVAGGALTLCLLANIASGFAPAAGIFAARIIVGGTTGLILWIFFGMVTRLRNPTVILAMLSTLQCSAGLAFSMLVSVFLLRPFGAMGGFGALAAANLVALCLVVAIPTRFAPARGPQKLGWPDLRGFATLLLPMLMTAGVLAAWVFLVPILRDRGISAIAASQAVSVGLGGQIAGGLLAMFLASRLRPVLAIGGSVVAAITGLALIYFGSGIEIMAIGFALIGLSWIFSIPFQMPFLLEADPTHRTAMLMSPAQIVGAATGPALVGLFLVGAGVSVAIWLSLALFAMTACVLLVFRRPSPSLAT